MAEIKDPMIGVESTSHEIRDSIRRTRARMDATVDALEEKLTPGELAAEAWGLVRGGSSSGVGRIWRIARQYPLPAAIIGVGVGWMVYESARGDEGQARHWPPARYADEPGAMASARRGAASAAERVTGAAGSAVERTGELAGQAREAVGGVAEGVRRRTSELGEQVSELGTGTRRGLERTRAGFRDLLEDQPLVAGAAALAAGALVGLLLPSTRAEDEMMGETRDSLMDEVRGLGQEALEKGKQVATAATEAVQQGAEAPGPRESAAEKARGVGRDVTETMRSEGQKQGMIPPAAPSQEPREGQPPPQQPPRHRAA